MNKVILLRGCFFKELVSCSAHPQALFLSKESSIQLKVVGKLEPVMVKYTYGQFRIT